MCTGTISRLLSLALLTFILATFPALAEKKYGPGVTDTEIKIGQTMPYSGPASAYGTVGKAEAAYFEIINTMGGLKGRKIKLLSLDDGYSPAKTVEQTRKLVEQDEVFFIFSSLGSAPNTAIQKYLNGKKVPQLFIAADLAKFGDPEHYPWTMGLYPAFQSIAKVYAKYILAHYPNAHIAVLYQNDDYGKDWVKGLREGLGDNATKMIVSEVTYEVTDPTIDSQIATLKGSGADTFANFTTPKFAAQAIRRAYDIGWNPLQFVPFPVTSIESVLKPAGLEKSVGLISVAFLKDPADPQWKDDTATQAYLAWIMRYNPTADPHDFFNVDGYVRAQLLVEVLRQCGDELTRENVMHRAANLRDVELPMLLPGIKINTSRTDYFPVKQMQLERFDGKRWVRFGDILGRE